MLSAIFTLLKLVNLLAGWARDKGLMNQGAQLEVSKNLRAIADRCGIAREIEAETAKMTPDEILRDLQGAGELRD